VKSEVTSSGLAIPGGIATGRRCCPSAGAVGVLAAGGAGGGEGGVAAAGSFDFTRKLSVALWEHPTRTTIKAAAAIKVPKDLNRGLDRHITNSFPMKALTDSPKGRLTASDGLFARPPTTALPRSFANRPAGRSGMSIPSL